MPACKARLFQVIFINEKLCFCVEGKHAVLELIENFTLQALSN